MVSHQYSDNHPCGGPKGARKDLVEIKVDGPNELQLYLILSVVCFVPIMIASMISTRQAKSRQKRFAQRNDALLIASRLFGPDFLIHDLVGENREMLIVTDPDVTRIVLVDVRDAVLLPVSIPLNQILKVEIVHEEDAKNRTKPCMQLSLSDPARPGVSLEMREQEIAQKWNDLIRLALVHRERNRIHAA